MYFLYLYYIIIEDTKLIDTKLSTNTNVQINKLLIFIIVVLICVIESFKTYFYMKIGLGLNNKFGYKSIEDKNKAKDWFLYLCVLIGIYFILQLALIIKIFVINKNENEKIDNVIKIYMVFSIVTSKFYILTGYMMAYQSHVTTPNNNSDDKSDTSSNASSKASSNS